MLVLVLVVVLVLDVLGLCGEKGIRSLIISCAGFLRQTKTISGIGILSIP